MVVCVQKCRGAAVRFAGASREREVDAPGSALARLSFQPYRTALVTQPLHGDKTFVEDRVGSTYTDSRLHITSLQF
jgi:hypothetical protein